MPVYNEEDNIVPAIKSALLILEKITNNFELILIDDGSTDDTIINIQLLAEKDKRIRLIRHKFNLGYGRALRTGIESSTKEFTFYTDSDNQFDISSLPLIIMNLKPDTMIIGFRINRRDYWQRLLISRIYGWFVHFLFDIDVQDVNCSFKLFSTDLFRKYPLKSNTVFIDTEMIIKAKHAGIGIYQVPVKHHRRKTGISKFELGKKGMMMVIHPLKVIEIIGEIIYLFPSLSGFSKTTSIDNPNGKRTALRK